MNLLFAQNYNFFAYVGHLFYNFLCIFAGVKKRLFLYYIVLFLLLLVGCKRTPENPKPDNLIDSAKLTDMMTEQLVIESVIFFAPPDSNKIALSIHLYNDFLLKHHVTKEQYNQSVAYYFADREQSNVIMHRISDRLIAEREEKLKE